MEAEIIALTDATKELLWIKNILSEAQLFPNMDIKILEYNQACIAFCTNNGTFHKRSKHIDVRYHFIKDHIVNGPIKLEYCESANNIADMFTKYLPKPKLVYHTSKVLKQGEC